MRVRSGFGQEAQPPEERRELGVVLRVHAHAGQPHLIGLGPPEGRESAAEVAELRERRADPHLDEGCMVRRRRASDRQGLAERPQGGAGVIDKQQDVAEIVQRHHPVQRRNIRARHEIGQDRPGQAIVAAVMGHDSISQGDRGIGDIQGPRARQIRLRLAVSAGLDMDHRPHGQGPGQIIVPAAPRCTRDGAIGIRHRLGIALRFAVGGGQRAVHQSSRTMHTGRLAPCQEVLSLWRCGAWMRQDLFTQPMSMYHQVGIAL